MVHGNVVAVIDMRGCNMDVRLFLEKSVTQSWLMRVDDAKFTGDRPCEEKKQAIPTPHKDHLRT
jgi:hypothetical protein